MTHHFEAWTRAIDWGRVAPLRLRAKAVADGVFAGTHRSRRRGPGVEFGGHRPYVPGDDLRWIDRRSLMRHNRLMVRLFETETDRTLHLLVDATASMGFRGKDSPTAKIGFAALLAAVLARVALSAGDPVSLHWIGGKGPTPVPASSTGETFDRVVRALGTLQATGDLHNNAKAFERALEHVAQKARRGATVVLLSDFLDLPPGSADKFAALGTMGRRLMAVQVLDREELTLPYHGTVQLVSLEGNTKVETDPNATRNRYVDALDAWTQRWTDKLSTRAGRLLRTPTDEDPISGVLSILGAIAEIPA